MKDWVAELMEALKSGDSEYFRPAETITGAGTGFWEAPRGALYHSENVKDGKIQGYQIIIPSTWNLAPHAEDGSYGPLEQRLSACRWKMSKSPSTRCALSTASIRAPHAPCT